MKFFAIAGVAVSVLSAVALSTPADAQQWPARQVRLIVPYPAGGNVDSAARIIADRLQAKLGQPFIVENKAGAGGLIAGEAFAKVGARRLHLVRRRQRPGAVRARNRQARRL